MNSITAIAKKKTKMNSITIRYTVIKPLDN